MMPSDNNVTQLRDIKPLVEIADNSIYLYWGLIVLGGIVLVVAIYILIKKIKPIKRTNKAKEYLEILKTIDWSKPKEASYSATHYGRLLARDERRAELYVQLVPMLEQYKYKKEVSQLDDDTKRQFELFIRICDESI